MEKRHLEKKKRVYVLATLDIPTQYLTYKDGYYGFVRDIEMATKAANRATANILKSVFYYGVNTDLELVILPLEIRYELIEEINDNI